APRAGAPSPRALSTCPNSRRLINPSLHSRRPSAKRAGATTGTCEHVSGEGKPRRSRGGLGHPRSEGLNPYSYGFNSPRNWVDPSGLTPDGVSTFDAGPTFSPDPAITSTSGDSGYTYTPDAFSLDTVSGSPPGTSGGGVGVLSLPPSVGSWTPGADQAADVMPCQTNDTSGPADGSGDWRGAL